MTVSGNGDIKKQTGSGQISVSVAGVSLDKTEIVLVEGSSEKLTATVEPANATNKGVTWSSDHEAIATVDQNGAVTARRGGQATITVTTADGSKTATCTVRVKIQIGEPVQSVGLNKTELALEVGKTGTLEAKVEPSDATNKNVTWSSSNPEVATVDNGVVTAVSAGEAIITVTTEDGAKTATCKVTVNAPQTVPVTGVTLDKAELTLEKGSTGTLKATVEPQNATNNTVTWSSSNPEFATVANGTVTAVSAGTATITVTTADGNHKATCTVTVIPKTVQVSGIQVQGSASVYVGGSTKLTATVTPTNATNQKVTWSSNNESVATVGTDGTVTAVSAGTATITVTTEDGQKTAACTVTVLSVDRTKLFALLQGSGVLLATPTSADGSEFSSDQKWVTVAEKQALQTVADSAKTVYDSSTADKDTVDTAYRNLQTAVTTFQKAMKPGTKTETPAAASFWNFW